MESVEAPQVWEEEEHVEPGPVGQVRSSRAVPPPEAVGPTDAGPAVERLQVVWAVSAQPHALEVLEAEEPAR